MCGCAARALRFLGCFVGESFDACVCDADSGVSSPIVGRSDGAVMNPIADGVGVIGGGVLVLGFLRFRGDGVAGGGMFVASALILTSVRTSCSEFAEDDDNLIERRSDMAKGMILTTRKVTACNMLL